MPATQSVSCWIRRSIPLLVGGMLLAACSSAPPKPSGSVGTAGTRAVPADIASIPLTTQTGATTTLAKMKGKTVFAVPFLTLCPDVCPFTTGNVTAVQASITQANQGKDVVVLEWSVDPERDTTARLAAYAKMTGANWTMVRTSKANTKKLMAFFGAVIERQPIDPSMGDDPIDWMTHEPLTYDVIHSDGFNIINAEGVEKFISGAPPAFHGTLPSGLNGFLSEEGKATLKKAPQNGWTPADALEAISYVSGTSIPLSPPK
jgi:protein SCO1/2